MRGRWSQVLVRGGVALLVLAACSSKALTPDGGAGTPDVASERAEGGRCSRTADYATIAAILLPSNGERLSCDVGAGDAGAAAPRTWVGKVTDSDETTLVVDLCVGDVGCVPKYLSIEARAPGLDLRRFPREWVQVRAAFIRFFGCSSWLEITAVAPPDGSPAPRPAGELLLAVVDGVHTYTGAGISVVPARLGCSSEKGCGSPIPDEYALDFASASNAAPLRVYMGETVTWTPGTTPLRVRNLRSYQSTACDDYWNWAFTIYIDPKP